MLESNACNVPGVAFLSEVQGFASQVLFELLVDERAQCSGTGGGRADVLDVIERPLALALLPNIDLTRRERAHVLSVLSLAVCKGDHVRTVWHEMSRLTTYVLGGRLR